MSVFLSFLCIIGTTIGLWAALQGAIHDKKEAIFAGIATALTMILFLVILAQSGWLS